MTPFKTLTMTALMAVAAASAHAAQPELAPLTCKTVRIGESPLALEQAERQLEAARGKDPLTEADALHAYAELKYFGREPTYAAELSDQANAIWRAAPATEALAARLQQRAQVLMALDSCALAAPLLRTALTVSERASGAQHPHTTSVLADLVRLELAQRDMTAFRQDGARLAQAWAQQGEPADNLAAPVYARLVDLYYRQDQFGLAEPLALRSVKNGELAYGVQSPALIQRLDDLAAVYAGQLRYDEAQAVFRRADQIAAKDNPKAFRLQSNSQKQIEEEMRLLFRQGNVGGALARGEQELKQLEQRFSETSAALQQAIKTREAAEPGSQQMNQLSTTAERARIEAENSEKQLATMRVRVAELYHHQRRYDLAEALYQKALFNYTEAQADPLVSAPVQSALAMLYRARAEDERALPLQRQALEVLIAAYGAEHPDVIDSARELALIYQHQGKRGEATAVAARVPAVQQR